MFADAIGALALVARCREPDRRSVRMNLRLAAWLAVLGGRRALVGAPDHALDDIAVLHDGRIGPRVELDGGLRDQREDDVRTLRPRILLFLCLLRGELHRLFGFVLPIRTGVFVDLVFK